MITSSHHAVFRLFLLASLMLSMFAEGATCLIAAPPRSLNVAGNITQVSVLEQNWSDDEASWFYNVPQGSKLIPYDWFLNLEQPDSPQPFRDNEHIRKLGYLPRTPAEGNADGLPIGFAKDGRHLGLTCAACHTGLISYHGQAWLIDGAPTLGDIETTERLPMRRSSIALRRRFSAALRRQPIRRR